MSSKIDGVALANQHKQKLIVQLQQLSADRQPTIVSFCNTEDPASVKYTQMKYQKAGEIGIKFIIEEYDTSTEQLTLADKIDQYNADPTVDGIMVQLPVPLDLVVFQQDLLERIEAIKDVDGLTDKGQQYYLPATVKSVISILNAEVEEWQNMSIAVIGASGEVGRPLVAELQMQGVEQICQIDRTHGDLQTDLKKAQVIISATGHEHLVKAAMLNPGSVLIDVGLGDFDPACYELASKYTAKIGGVGPMTVVSLMENVVESFSRRITDGN